MWVVRECECQRGTRPIREGSCLPCSEVSQRRECRPDEPPSIETLKHILEHKLPELLKEELLTCPSGQHKEDGRCKEDDVHRP
jgi:hypothetical protein